MFRRKKFLEENPEFDGKLKTIKIDEKFADTSASAIREKYNDKTPDEYIDDMNAEIRKNEAPPAEVLLHTPIFDVVKGEKTETGLEPVLVKAPDWVTVIVEENGKFLTVEQFRYGARRDIVEFTCGMVEPGEDPEAAARRELEEETGYTTNRIEKLLALRTTIAFCDEFVDVYLARDLVKCSDQHLDDGESIDVEIHTLEELCDMIYSGKLQDGKTVSAILAYSNMIHQK